MALGQLKLGVLPLALHHHGQHRGIGVFVTVTGFEVSGEAVKFVSGHFTGPLRFTVRRRPFAHSVGLSA